MIKQLTLIPQGICSQFAEDRKQQKKKWENAFQKWSDKQSEDGTEPYGCCGYGTLCDWCNDNTYGRPCVRALNRMCFEKRIKMDYSDNDFEKIWMM